MLTEGEDDVIEADLLKSFFLQRALFQNIFVAKINVNSKQVKSQNLSKNVWFLIVKKTQKLWLLSPLSCS